MASLTETLLSKGLITAEQLNDARDKQAGAKQPLVSLLLEMGFLREEDLLALMSELFGLTCVSLPREKIDPSAVKRIPFDMAKRYGVMPLRAERGELVVATNDPTDLAARDDLTAVAEMPVRFVLACRGDVNAAIETYYHVDDAMYDLLKNVAAEASVEVVKESDPDEISSASAVDAAGAHSPVIKLVNLILTDAARSRASDIHIEPQETHDVVRYRIDGELRQVMKVPRSFHNALMARIKIIARLDIAESRKPQDGRCSLVISGEKIDLRVSLVPAFHGEKCVIRLLDARLSRIALTQLGFDDGDLAVFKTAAARPQGMILVTGPTGSGKTSTLYAALNHLKNETRNIVTIEDPVEYLMEGINQIQINPVKDLTFATGLRSILRQDPNVILVGEIRDRETADIAFRSSQTGHLVFSTLHANSAVASVTRLVDIGLEPYLMASSLALVVAQRLLRLICPQCKQPYTPDPALVQRCGNFLAQAPINAYYRGKGCAHCDYTGYYGRAAIGEFMPVTDALRESISRRAPEDEVFMQARNAGMRTMFESGLAKVRQGVTTLEELLRVVDVPGVLAPVVAQSPVASVAEAPVAAVQATITTILLAEDEDDIAKVLAKRLEAAGYNVLRARDGAEEVALATQHMPDLIITDAMMPVMDGFAAIKALRAHLATAALPIIMLTAKKDKESELAGFDAGADDYLTKPFDHDKLLARVRMLLARRKR